MISSFGDLSVKYLKMQKKRTALLILGVLMSAALITGTGTIIESAKHQMIAGAVRQEGNFHVCFKNIDSGQAFLISNNTAVAQSCTGRISGFAVLAETGNDRIPYRLLRLNQNDDNAVEMLQIKNQLMEGRLPAAADEIAVDLTTMKILGTEIGINDSIKLRTGQRRLSSDDSIITSELYPLSINENYKDSEEYFSIEDQKTFRITGILSEDVFMSENYSSNAVIYNDSRSADDIFNMLVLLNKPEDAVAAAESIAETIGLDSSDILYNHRLLNLSGYSTDKGFRNSMIGFNTIVTAIIILATIAVIYNSFNISLIERISQFGVLRCIGASPAQIRDGILREAGLISLIAVPPGLLIGIGAMKIVFMIADSLSSNPLFEGIVLIVSPPVLISSAVICIITVFCSAFVPAVRASRIPAIEAVRSTGMYSHDNIGNRRFFRFRGIFQSFSTIMALRNISRNRKRFLVTLFSMVISVVLYVSFGGMLSLGENLYLVKNVNMPGLKLKADTPIPETVYAELSKVADVDMLIKYGTKTISIIADEKKLSKHYIDNVENLPDFDRTPEGIIIPGCRIICYGDYAMNEIAALTDGGDPSGIMLAQRGAFRNSAGIKAYYPNSTYEAGDSISLIVSEKAETVKISAVLSDVYYEDFNDIEGGIDLIVGEALYKQLTGTDGFTELYIRLIPGGDKKDLVSYLDKLTNTSLGYEYIDAQANAAEMSRETMAINLFFYGFIIVIALIGCLNIINTISTNLLIRSREFGIIQAVGSDRRGIGKMILKESILYSVSALVLGSIIGTLLWYLLVRQANNIRLSIFQIPWQEIGIAAAGLVVITLVSGYLSLRRISGKSIIENIKFEE